MILVPTSRRIIRPYEKPSFEHTQRYGLIKGHPLGPAGGLILFMPENEGSGNIINDLSGGGHRGTFQGTAPSWTSGKFGSAILLPGTDEYINIPDKPAIRSPRTISIWIKQNAYVESAFIGHWPSVLPGEDQQNILLYTRNNHWKFIWDTRGSGGTSKAAEGSVDISSDLTWHHLIFIARPTSLEIWDNGRRVAVTLSCDNADRTDTLDVIISSGANPFNGLVDVSTMYNRDLSPSEIVLLHREPFCMIQKKVAPYYFFVPIEVEASTKREWYTTGLDDGFSVEGLYHRGQSFTIGNTGVNENCKIKSVKVMGFKYFAGANELLYAAIKAVDGEGKPTGEELSTGSIDPTDWGIGIENAELHEILMSEYTLLESTQYVLILRSPDNSGNTSPVWGSDVTSPAYTGGVQSYSSNSGETWTLQPTKDFLFEIWGEPVGVVKELAGTVVATSSVSGTVKPARGLVGTITAESTVTVTVDVLRKISGAVESQSSVDGSVSSIWSIASTVTCESTVSGQIKVTRELVASLTPLCTTTGVLKTVRELVSAVTTQSTVDGSLSGIWSITSTVTAVGSATGVLDVIRKLVSAVTCAGSVSGSLTVSKLLAGTVTSVASTTGALKVARELIVSVTAQGTVNGQVDVLRKLVTSVACVSTISGNLIIPAGGFSDYAETHILDHIVGKTSYSKPTVAVGLCIGDPTDAGTGGDCNEVANENDYARVPTIGADWGAAVAGAIDNANPITFPEASGSWGEITHYALFDSQVYGEGRMLIYDALDIPKDIVDEEIVKFSAGKLKLVLN